MPASLKLQPQAITQETFDRLPALLVAWHVKLVTGWDDHELAQAVKDGSVKTWKAAQPRKGCKRRYRKYLKTSVAKVVGFRT